MNRFGPITAIVTAYQRVEQTLETIRRLKACKPAPDEILVHVDANQTACADAIASAFPDLRVLQSADVVGPGGGRNKLIAAARNERIASFDDDSYPLDGDFFERVLVLTRTFPDAALIGGSIIHRGEDDVVDRAVVSVAASFAAGGVVLCRSDFLAAGGFVPLSVAYGMEEEDLSLRLIDRGKTVLTSPWLRIFHDTDLSHHRATRVTSGSIANLALLAWLRYPLAYWPYGGLQVLNRVAWCLRVGRIAGIVQGLASIPAHVGRHRHLRQPVSRQTMRLRFAARASLPVPFDPRAIAPENVADEGKCCGGTA